MAEVINLDELIPEDKIFKLGDKTFTLPGDVDTETVFRLFNLYADLTKASVDGVPIEQVKEIGDRVKLQLLWIFRQRDLDLDARAREIEQDPLPNLKTESERARDRQQRLVLLIPFGIRSLQIVMQEVLKAIGLLSEGEEDGAEATPPEPPAAPRGQTLRSRTGGQRTQAGKSARK